MMNMQSAQLLERATSALSSGQWDEAVALCRRVLASDSNNLQAHLLWASALLPGDNYLTVLDRIHRHLRPRTYVEIGVETGRSLALAQPGTTCIAIDPRPQLAYRIPDLARVH